MPSPRIVAIETSSRSGSVAIARGADLLGEQFFSTRTEHARDLLPALDELCRINGWPPGEADYCCVSIGPGSFTGLRVAITFARHLALARGTKLVAVPTLAVIAERWLAAVTPPSPLAVLLDAKRGRVFAAAFELVERQYRQIREPAEVEPGEWLCHLNKELGAVVCVTGEGVGYHQEAVRQSGAHIVDASGWTPSAAYVHRVGWRMALEGRFTAPRELVPLYVRRPEAEEVWERRQAAEDDSRKA